MPASTNQTEKQQQQQELDFLSQDTSCEKTNKKFYSGKYSERAICADADDSEETKREQKKADLSGPMTEAPMLAPTTFMHPVTPFQEKHMVESLDVQAVDPAKTVLFYNMLN